MVPKASWLHLKMFVWWHVNKDRFQLYTDESPSYERISHQGVNHSAGQYVDEDCHTNGIESFWAVFNRSWYGTHH